MGYHSVQIPKGVLGEFSKIKEEFLEAEDAVSQKNPIMALVELSDLVGAIEAYVRGKHGLELMDVITMTDATKRAFADGTRTSRDEKTVVKTEDSMDLRVNGRCEFLVCNVIHTGTIVRIGNYVSSQRDVGGEVISDLDGRHYDFKLGEEGLRPL